MRLLLGALLAPVLALGLAGCGDDTADRAGDPTPTPSSTTSSPADIPLGPVPFDLVAVVSGSAQRGTKVSPDPVVLADEGSVQDYAQRFQGSLPGDILEAAREADVADDEQLVAAVVDVGCEPPTQIHVRRTADRLQVTATPVKSRVQCFVPVTSIALVVVPAAAL